MILHAIFFYVFACVCIASAIMVIASRNPVHSVLFLILAFVNAAGLFVLLGAEFLAMILIVVYVGAVAVLFLFVVMMLDVDFAELRQGFLNYLPVGVVVGGVLLAELLFVVVARVDPARRAEDDHGADPSADAISNTQALGLVLYTRYVYYFEAAGVILLVAMIGAIVLTLHRRAGVKRQSIADQVARNRASAIDVVKVEIGAGRCHDHRARTLSVGRRDPVHARDLRHLSQPQEHHHHSDVDRAHSARGEHQSGRVLDLPRRSSSARSIALIVLTVAAAEAAIGLAILVAYFRNRGSIAVEDVNLMKG